jgi:hypothetical protein
MTFLLLAGASAAVSAVERRSWVYAALAVLLLALLAQSRLLSSVHALVAWLLAVAIAAPARPRALVGAVALVLVRRPYRPRWRILLAPVAILLLLALVTPIRIALPTALFRPPIPHHLSICGPRVHC